ncbi:uncharacterized protein LOC123320924 [Coccinella septempunctata]|uniref:uncharacterized protein LOC123320924 n=1 Tax=Coccinella septempunctata TaxID=41139 RepID=UPI001D07639A|nr:uncharacterized protein LOC123320924 [Coccinella septempunctata]
MEYSTTTTSEREYNEFLEKIQFLSYIQGSIPYILMSLLEVHHDLVVSYMGKYFFPFLFYNMVYGMAVMLYMRPSMRRIYGFHRLTFSILGSLMFNHSSVKFFSWLIIKMPQQPLLRTAVAFVCGRIIIFFFISYLYHVDNTVGITIFQRI